eukprot:RCo046187
MSWRLNSFMAAIGLWSPYRGSMHDYQRHIVVSGFIEQESLETFLHEIFHDNHGYTDLSVCVLCNKPPDLSMKRLLKSKQAVNRVTYLQGSVLSLEDLSRARVGRAAAVFLLTSKATPDDQKQRVDGHVILCTLSVHQYNPEVPILVQILLPSSQPAVYNVGATSVVCVTQLRAQLLASACYCRGVQTIISNLVTSHSPPVKDAAKWLVEYKHGAR